jgi:hypothetical protein
VVNVSVAEMLRVSFNRAGEFWAKTCLEAQEFLDKIVFNKVNVLSVNESVVAGCVEKVENVGNGE